MGIFRITSHPCAFPNPKKHICIAFRQTDLDIERESETFGRTSRTTHIDLHTPQEGKIKTLNSPLNVPERLSESMSKGIEQLVGQFCHRWVTQSESPVTDGRMYSRSEQRRNESRLMEALPEEGLTGIAQCSDEQFEQLRSCVQDLLMPSMDHQRHKLVEDMFTTFSDAGGEFVRRSEMFDRDLRPEGIFQALRNEWIINSMQAAFGLPVRMNPSGLAYSLLYTYSDNVLDSPGVGEADKEEFLNLFERRLMGAEISDHSKNLKRISSLVGMIEEEFPRHRFPGVYESLLAIHNAQAKSLRQRAIGGNEREILEISVEKGGTSVVADAYVTRGTLTQVDIDFSFTYGAILQFIDDLQDVTEDRSGGSETIFTLAAGNGVLDGLTNRLIRHVLTELPGPSLASDSQMAVLWDLIRQGSLGLILESIALNPEFFSGEYLRAAELRSPVGFEAIRKLYHDRSSSSLYSAIVQKSLIRRNRRSMAQGAANQGRELQLIEASR